MAFNFCFGLGLALLEALLRSARKERAEARVDKEETAFCSRKRELNIYIKYKTPLRV